jgi:hypothetical protein
MPARNILVNVEIFFDLVTNEVKRVLLLVTKRLEVF